MKIDYLKFGEHGKSIVFLHGWQQDKRSFFKLVPYLYKDYQIFLLDLPGFGKSDLPPENYNSYNYAETITKWIKKRNLEKIILVGHSFGGKIAAITASNNPKLVKKLILISSSGIIHPKKWYPLKNSLPQPFQKTLKPILEHFFASRDYKQAGKLLHIFKNVVKEDCRPIFKKIKQPTLIIWGRKDKELPTQDGKTINKLIKNSMLSIIKGDHFPFVQQPTKCADLIKDFI